MPPEVENEDLAPEAPPVGEAEAPADSGQDWSKMTAEAEGDEPDLERAPALKEDSDEEPLPIAAAPKEEPPPAPVAVAPPEPPVAPPPVEPPKVEPQVAQQPPQPPQQTPAEWQQLRESYVKELESQYVLNEEDAQKFVLNPNEVIPRLAANLHANILQQAIATVMQAVQGVLPQAISQAQDTRQASQTNEEKFFGKWPELSAHKDTVMQVGRLWRAQNPQASLEDFIENVGIASWIQSKLSVADLAARMDSAPSAATPPSPRAQPTPTGYRPASPAAGAPPPKPKVEDNFFASLASEMKEDFF